MKKRYKISQYEKDMMNDLWDLKEKSRLNWIEVVIVLGFLVLLFLNPIFSDAGTLHFGAGKTPAKVNEVSAEITATGQLITGTCAFKSIIVKTDGTNNVTISVFEGTDNSGDKLIPYQTIVPGNSRVWMYEYSIPIRVVGGVYVEITTSGTARVMGAYDQG